MSKIMKGIRDDNTLNKEEVEGFDQDSASMISH